jgi:nicotinate-nucleotide--dimethylbenzimidazole phosphoribosyltransferase
MLDFLNLKPLLNLQMRLGEGTGAALGFNLLEAGVKIYREMATFEEAGVAEKED